MEFDIIEISREELAKLKPAKMTLLRKAQQKKNALIQGFEKKVREFNERLFFAGMNNSSLGMNFISEKYKEVYAEIDVLADNLLYEMSLIDLKDDGSEENKNNNGSTEDTVGYLVDYSLSYNERYVIVRNYYLAIKDRDVRMEKYGKDETAQKYLGTYYNTLYNILATYEDNQ